jgi:Zn-dependent metalloprotease
VALDVSGHEMAHGVMSTEANLTYNGESGGLNEANSDIFGTMVEFYANNPVAPPNYWVGERSLQANYIGGVYSPRQALRYMDDPAKDGRSPTCWYDGIRRLDVHYSSGPANHMFYLLSGSGQVQGKCNNTQVPGIGREKAARIWYNAIVNYMTARTNYADARAACLDSAAALYGFGSDEYLAVGAAFAAINVR